MLSHASINEVDKNVQKTCCRMLQCSLTINEKATNGTLEHKVLSDNRSQPMTGVSRGEILDLKQQSPALFPFAVIAANTSEPQLCLTAFSSSLLSSSPSSSAAVALSEYEGEVTTSIWTTKYCPKSSNAWQIERRNCSVAMTAVRTARKSTATRDTTTTLAHSAVTTRARIAWTPFVRRSVSKPMRHWSNFNAKTIAILS